MTAKKIQLLLEVLELVQDELKVIELMTYARNDDAIIGLYNLRRILQQARKSYL